jgi:hypothetical protein
MYVFCIKYEQKYFLRFYDGVFQPEVYVPLVVCENIWEVILGKKVIVENLKIDVFEFINYLWNIW